MRHVQRVRPGDWPAWRAIRLEALADSPIGFLELLADAERKPDEQWQERTTAAASGDEHGLWLALDGDRPLGCAGGRRYDAGPVVLVYSVYVTPAARGSGVLDALLAEVRDWALGLDGVDELRLEVHEDNAPALAAYERRGFVLTGAWQPYPPDPARRELEMALPLRRT